MQRVFDHIPRRPIGYLRKSERRFHPLCVAAGLLIGLALSAAVVMWAWTF